MYTTKKLDDIELFTKDNEENTCLYLSKAACLGFKDCLTKEEEIVLADIRALREKAINVKSRLKRLENCTTSYISVCQDKIQSMSPERQALMDELDDLKKKRGELDRLMEEAHHRKMVLLGHRKP